VKFRAVIEQDEGGMFVATCPRLPGCVTQGTSVNSALEDIRDAINAYMESLRKHGEDIPPDPEDEQ